MLNLVFLLGGCTLDEPAKHSRPLRAPTVDTATDTAVDADGDGHPAETDCDDADPDVHPGAEEVCDGNDDNCDGQVDEGVRIDGYADEDGDGFGDPASPEAACPPTEGHATRAGDCDDGDPNVNPNAPEMCDGVDNDCDGALDPASTEVCDGRDNDCDGLVDDADDDVDPSTYRAWYADDDGDGFGDVDRVVSACEAPSGYGVRADDCDDGDATVYPRADDLCDGLDNDCDGSVDEGWSPEVCDALDNDCDGLVDDADDSLDTSTRTAWYADADGDGFGDASASVSACEAPAGYVAPDDDCDDAASAVNPGVPEVCDAANGIDDDCDGWVDPTCGAGTILEEDWMTWSGGDSSSTATWSGVGTSASACSSCDVGWTFAFTGSSSMELLSSSFDMSFAFDASDVAWGGWYGAWYEDTLYVDLIAVDAYTYDPTTGKLAFTYADNCSGDPDCGRGGVSWGWEITGTLWVTPE